MSKRMLLADDSGPQRRITTELFKKRYAGLEIDQAEDGVGLVEMAKSGGYALILTDNDMPNLQGVDAVEQIRAYDQTTPLYLYSSSLPGDLPEGLTGAFEKEALMFNSDETLRTLDQYLMVR